MEGMQAGPELDALVAERAMGWKRLPTRNESGMAYPERFTQRWMLPGGITTRDLSRFSEYWDAAGLVVEKLGVEGYEIRIGFSKGTRYASFYKNDDHNPRTAQTIPHAICLAALAAKGVRCQQATT